MEQSKHWKAIVTVLAIVLAIVGILAIPGDVQDAVGMLGWTKTHIPWWALLIVATGVVVALWGKAAWKGITQLREALRHWVRMNNRHLKEAEARIQRITTELKECRSTREHLTVTNAEKAAELLEKDRAIQAAAKQRDTWYQVLTFGREYPDIEMLPEAARESVIGNLQQLLPTLQQVIMGKDFVWQEVWKEVERSQYRKWVEPLYNRITQDEYSKAVESGRVLGEQLVMGRDVRAAFVVFLAAYQNWKPWVNELLRLAQNQQAMWPKEGFKHFAEWQEGEKEFTKYFKNILGMSHMLDVKRSLFALGIILEP